MLAELPHSTRHARWFPSLLLLACSAVCVAGCDRPEAAKLGSESGAVRPDSAEPDAVPVADFKSVAIKVVQQSAGVREGEIVLIAGSDEDLPLLEDIAIECRNSAAMRWSPSTPSGSGGAAMTKSPPSMTARPPGLD